MLIRFLALTALLFLAGCQTIIGSGPLTLSDGAKQRVERAMSDPATDYIAVSTDGRYVAWSYCRDGLAAQCRGDGAVIAVDACEESGMKCYVYAKGRQVVWDFDGRALPGKPQAEANWTHFALVPGDGQFNASFEADWDADAGRAELSRSGNGKRIRDCTGYFTASPGATGTWQLTCADGVTFSGSLGKRQGYRRFGAGVSNDNKAVTVVVSGK